MQLNLYEYDSLCLDDRLHLTWSVGIPLAQINTRERVYRLYAVFEYYVEVIAVHMFSETTVTSAVAFREGNRLEKYLDAIDLSGLLNS